MLEMPSLATSSDEIVRPEMTSTRSCSMLTRCVVTVNGVDPTIAPDRDNTYNYMCNNLLPFGVMIEILSNCCQLTYDTLPTWIGATQQSNLSPKTAVCKKKIMNANGC